MKVYSDSLTHDDLYAACDHAGVGLETVEEIARARVRAHGWTVRLRGSSTRHHNSGTYGADTWSSSPATWDEHGRWMAYLFAIDPNARISYYDGAEHFARWTGGEYPLPVLSLK